MADPDLEPSQPPHQTLKQLQPAIPGRPSGEVHRPLSNSSSGCVFRECTWALGGRKLLLSLSPRCVLMHTHVDAKDASRVLCFVVGGPVGQGCTQLRHLSMQANCCLGWLHLVGSAPGLLHCSIGALHTAVSTRLTTWLSASNTTAAQPAQPGFPRLDPSKCCITTEVKHQQQVPALVAWASRCMPTSW